MIRCVVVDDEPLAIEVLRKFISEHPSLALVETFTRPMDAFAFLQLNEIDILFLDIQMPELTGLELVKSIRSAPAIVFTTAFRDFALEGFELHALDYLVKPIAKERFDRTIQKYLRSQSAGEPKAENRTNHAVYVNVDKKLVRLDIDDICYVEALKNYVRIVCVSKTIVTHHALTNMQEKLPADKFLRIHRSYIINVLKVDSFSAENVEVEKTDLPVGDVYREAFLLRMRQ